MCTKPRRMYSASTAGIAGDCPATGGEKASSACVNPDAVQDTFIQQRGFESNKLGKTGDVRSLQASGVLDAPISGPAEVSPLGDPDDVGSAFYDES